MNRTLTATAVLVASTAGIAGLSGTANADPAPSFPAAPTSHHGADDWMGSLQPAMRSVGHVVPSAARAAGKPAQGSPSRLPLINQSVHAAPASLLKAAPTQQGSVTRAASAPGDQPLSRSAMAVDPITTVEQLTGNVPLLGSLPLGKINALGHD